MTAEKPTSNYLLPPITIGANSAMNQSEFQGITCNLLKEREKLHARGAIEFGFLSHWLKTGAGKLRFFYQSPRHRNRNAPNA